MNIQWKKLLLTTTIWLVTEIIFNLLGLDNLEESKSLLKLLARSLKVQRRNLVESLARLN